MTEKERRLALVKKHFIDEGLSATATAKIMGDGATKNTVVGLAFRAGYERSPEVARQNNARNNPPRIARAKPKPLATEPNGKGIFPPPVQTQKRNGNTPPAPPPPVPLPPEERPPEHGDRIRCEDLKTHMCRWPLGDPQSADFTFCGARKASGPYCAGHAKKAWSVRPEKGRGSAAELARSLRRVA